MLVATISAVAAFCLLPKQAQGGRTFWNGSKIFALVRGGIAVHEVGASMG